MAQVETVSRSDAIREYLTANPNAGPKAVVEGLRAKGIVVKPGLVGSVKHHMQARGKKSRRRITAKPAVVAAPAMTGTQAIQAYVKEHPQAGPKEIRTALAGQGVNVSSSLVSAVKYRKRKRRAPAVRVAARATRSVNGTITVDRLLELKRFADSFGGVDQVRHGLETLAMFE